jgi:hypothetical protein
MQTQKNNVVYMVIWIVLLILVAWPLAWFIAPIWVFLLAFEALIPQGTLIAGVWHDEGFRCIERSPHAFSSLARFCNFLTSSRSLSRIAPSVKDVNSFLEKYVCQVAPTARLPNTRSIRGQFASARVGLGGVGKDLLVIGTDPSFHLFANRLLTWPRLVGTAIYESQESFPSPIT